MSVTGSSGGEVMLETTVTPEPRPKSSPAKFLPLLVAVAGIAHLTAVHPTSFGLPVVLPLAVWLAFVLRSRRHQRATGEEPFTVRFRAGVLEIEREHCVSHTAWSDITRVEEDEHTLMLGLPDRGLRIPRDQLPSTEAIAAMLPEGRTIERATIAPLHPPPAPTSSWLWLSAFVAAALFVIDVLMSGPS